MAIKKRQKQPSTLTVTSVILSLQFLNLPELNVSQFDFLLYSSRFEILGKLLISKKNMSGIISGNVKLSL